MRVPYTVAILPSQPQLQLWRVTPKALAVQPFSETTRSHISIPNHKRRQNSHTSSGWAAHPSWATTAESKAYTVHKADPVWGQKTYSTMHLNPYACEMVITSLAKSLWALSRHTAVPQYDNTNPFQVVLKLRAITRQMLLAINMTLPWPCVPRQPLLDAC